MIGQGRRRWYLAADGRYHCRVGDSTLCGMPASQLLGVDRSHSRRAQDSLRCYVCEKTLRWRCSDRKEAAACPA